MHTQTPKLRFPEFSDNWEVKKLGEIAKFSKGKGISKADMRLSNFSAHKTLLILCSNGKDRYQQKAS